MKKLLSILLLSILLGIVSEMQAAVCIDDATGEVWCQPESPVSPLSKPNLIYLPYINR